MCVGRGVTGGERSTLPPESSSISLNPGLEYGESIRSCLGFFCPTPRGRPCQSVECVRFGLSSHTPTLGTGRLPLLLPHPRSQRFHSPQARDTWISRHRRPRRNAHAHALKAPRGDEASFELDPTAIHGGCVMNVEISRRWGHDG